MVCGVNSIKTVGLFRVHLATPTLHQNHIIGTKTASAVKKKIRCNFVNIPQHTVAQVLRSGSASGSRCEIPSHEDPSSQNSGSATATPPLPVLDYTSTTYSVIHPIVLAGDANLRVDLTTN